MYIKEKENTLQAKKLFYSGFTSLSTIFQSYHDVVWMWQGAHCSLLECCLMEISHPRHMTLYSTCEIILETRLTISCSWGWLGVAKVSCSLRYWGVQLIMADSCARAAILVAGKSRCWTFLFLLFLHFHSCFTLFPVPLFHSPLLSLFSLSLGETQNEPQGLTCR